MDLCSSLCRTMYTSSRIWLLIQTLRMLPVSWNLWGTLWILQDYHGKRRTSTNSWTAMQNLKMMTLQMQPSTWWASLHQTNYSMCKQTLCRSCWITCAIWLQHIRLSSKICPIFENYAAFKSNRCSVFGTQNVHCCYLVSEVIRSIHR